MNEPINCPRCGSDDITYGYSIPPMQGSVECSADGCETVVVASSVSEAIERWNAGEWTHRVVDRDRMGNPIYARRTDG